MKTELRKKLSKVSDFDNPMIGLEQYRTPPGLAADIIYTAYMQNDIEGKKVVDLGTGTGMLATGAALLGAEVQAVDKDPEALKQACENFDNLSVDVEVLEADVQDFEFEVDTVVMNPPFSHHSDTGLRFWERAVEADAVYSVSPREMRERIKDFVAKSDHEVLAVEEFVISLPPSYGFHTEENHETQVDVFITRKR